MWNRSEIKARGKAAFMANRWACVIVALILAFAVGGGASSGRAANNDKDEGRAPVRINISLLGGAGLMGLAVQVLVLNPLEAGCRHFFIENSKDGEEKPQIGEVLYFFKDGRWGNAVKVMFVYKLVIALWTLLLIVPGIVKAYSFRLVPYLLNQNPDIDPREAMGLSSRLMKGQKGAAFAYDLSYIGWYFLGALTLGILYVLHVNPWTASADACLCRTIAGERQYTY